MVNIKIVFEAILIGKIIKNIIKEEFTSSNIEIFNSLNEISSHKDELICLVVGEDSLSELELAKKIKENYRDVKILVIDLGTGKNLLAEIIQYNIDGYIASIFKRREFVFIIEMLLDGKRYYDGYSIMHTVEKNNYYLFYGLTDREKEILNYVTEGMNNHEIARNVHISENTVKKHITNILNKLNLKNRKEILVHMNEYSLI